MSAQGARSGCHASGGLGKHAGGPWLTGHELHELRAKAAPPPCAVASTRKTAQTACTHAHTCMHAGAHQGQPHPQCWPPAPARPRPCSRRRWPTDIEVPHEVAAGACAAAAPLGLRQLALKEAVHLRPPRARTRVPNQRKERWFQGLSMKEVVSRVVGTHNGPVMRHGRPAGCTMTITMRVHLSTRIVDHWRPCACLRQALRGSGAKDGARSTVRTVHRARSTRYTPLVCANNEDSMEPQTGPRHIHTVHVHGGCQ